jgi:hypothetical protein
MRAKDLIIEETPFPFEDKNLQYLIGSTQNHQAKLASKMIKNYFV